MRTLSFILAVAFVLAGPSMAGSSENYLPGVGTFAYNGSPIVTCFPAYRRCSPLKRCWARQRKLPVRPSCFFVSVPLRSSLVLHPGRLGQ